MDKAKYIVVEIMVGVSMFETPILFPSFVGHDDMARSLGIVPGKVLGAGFVEFSAKEHLHCGLPFHVVEAVTYGKSTSLGVESREEDANLIRKALRLSE
jgi:hypothetical protein